VSCLLPEMNNDSLQRDLEHGSKRELVRSLTTRSDESRSESPERRKPMCWYGAACRQKHNSVHCDKYDHEERECKFGATCRRKERGCRFQHPAPGTQNKRFKNRNEVNNGNSLEAGPEPSRPVPFVFLLVCVCAAGLVVLPVLGGCNASMHKFMFQLGCALGVPFLLFEFLLKTRRAWMLRRFLEGDYSERATYRELGCLWYPEPLQLLTYTSGDVAGNNIEQYATWETNDVQQQVESAIGRREGGQVMRSENGFNMNFPDEFSSTDTTVDAEGNLSGLGVRAKFDGSNIVFGDGAWAKAGFWRLDWVTKVLLLLFMVGVECLFVSVLMPPGVVGLGGVSDERMPLNAVFVVDGSASIVPEMWQAQQVAGMEFIRAFNRTYGEKEGELNMGIVQFSTDARTEEPLTSDIQAVLTKFQNMQQMDRLTYFDKGLSLCKDNLAIYESGRESFDVCVLITDGLDMSEKKSLVLQKLLPSGTAIFGIFVGSDAKGIQLLKNVTDCGKAVNPNHECQFFASAEDYAVLSSKADEVASEVVRGVDLAMCAMVSALIGVPTALGMSLPYILWYVSFTGLTMWKRRHESNYRSTKGNNNVSNTE
jgi:hypothetical protein